jgi:hypothetical protein
MDTNFDSCQSKTDGIDILELVDNRIFSNHFLFCSCLYHNIVSNRGTDRRYA